MTKLDEILRDPSAVFADPADVLAQEQFSDAEKVKILQQWRYDMVQLQVAAQESLIGESRGAKDLTRIDDCLRQLGKGDDK